MSPLLAIAVALTALGLLLMLVAAWRMTSCEQRWPALLFDGGAGIFGLALTFWLIVSVAAFFATASHAS